MSTRYDTAEARQPMPWRLLLAVTLACPATLLAAPAPDPAPDEEVAPEVGQESVSASAMCRITITIPPRPLRLVVAPGADEQCVPVPGSSPAFFLRIDGFEPILFQPSRDQPVPLPDAATAGPRTVLVEPM